MPNRSSGFIATDEVENLRLGTREQFQSEWTVILDTETHTFTHGLSEIPWVCDVVYSENAQGGQARDASSVTTVSKTDTTITIANTFGDDDFVRYFQVRAM